MKISIFLAFTLTTSAFADFSYTSKTTLPGGMGGGPIATKHYFKGHKMKSETASTWMIADYEAGTQTVINIARKTYSVTKLGDGAGLDKKGAEMDMKADVKETGETKVINGYNTREAVMTIDSEVNLPGRGAIKSQMELHLWISKDVPGASELKAFYQRNANAFVGAAGAGAQKAMADVQRKVAAMGGVPVLTVMKMKSPGMGGGMGGGMSDAQSEKMNAGMAQARAKLEEMAKQGGPGAEMAKQQLARMGGGGAAGGMGGGGGMETTSEASEFSAAGIPDSVFAIPAGFQEVQMK